MSTVCARRPNTPRFPELELELELLRSIGAALAWFPADEAFSALMKPLREDVRRRCERSLSCAVCGCAKGQGRNKGERGKESGKRGGKERRMDAPLCRVEVFLAVEALVGLHGHAVLGEVHALFS